MQPAHEGLWDSLSYSYKVHKQKKRYLEDLFIIGDVQVRIRTSYNNGQLSMFEVAE